MKNIFLNNLLIFNRILLILIILICSLLLYLSIISEKDENKIARFINGNDFKLFYDESRLILKNEGQKIYDIENYKSNQPIKITDRIFNPNYTPVFYIFYLPLTLLPYEYSCILNSIFNLALYLITIYLFILIFPGSKNSNILSYFFLLFSRRLS